MKNYTKKSLKASNGITLIALVITIIILLILAGISIGMLSGENGILTQATHAKFASEVSDIKEQVELEQLKDDLYYSGSINDLLGINSVYNDKLILQEGELVYVSSNVSSREAKWFEQLGINKSSDYFTVEFDSAGGTEIDTQSIKFGKKIKQPANPTKAGYEFIGWYYLMEGGTEENPTYTEIAFNDFDIPIDRNYLLYAKYSGEAVMMARNNNIAFWQSTYRTNITNIKFTNDSNDVPASYAQSWNVRADSNCADVMAYLVGTSSNYSLILYSPYTIYSNYNSSSYFKDFSNLTTIAFGNFNTTKIETMYDMFSYCTKLSELDLSEFLTNKVKSMYGTFYHCEELLELDLSTFNTFKVQNMQQMFCGCKKLNMLNVGSFDTSNVKNMLSMFEECSELSELDVRGFNTINVNNMAHMFEKCNNIVELNLSNFDTSNVNSMYCMFNKCSKLSKLNVSSFDTYNVNNMSNMFNECTSLTKLDLSGFKIKNVNNISNMFNVCSNLATIICDDDWNSVDVPSSTILFSGCNKLEGAIKYNSSRRTIEYANPDTGYFTRSTQ